MKHWTTDGRIQSDTRQPAWIRAVFAWKRAPLWLVLFALRRLK